MTKLFSWHFLCTSFTKYRHSRIETIWCYVLGWGGGMFRNKTKCQRQKCYRSWKKNMSLSTSKWLQLPLQSMFLQVFLILMHKSIFSFCCVGRNMSILFVKIPSWGAHRGRAATAKPSQLSHQITLTRQWQRTPGSHWGCTTQVFRVWLDMLSILLSLMQVVTCWFCSWQDTLNKYAIGI